MTGLIIDNFESEEILDISQLIKLSNSNVFDKRLYQNELHSVIDNIHSLFTNAISFQTGIHFYF